MSDHKKAAEAGERALSSGSRALAETLQRDGSNPTHTLRELLQLVARQWPNEDWRDPRAVAVISHELLQRGFTRECALEGITKGHEMEVQVIHLMCLALRCQLLGLLIFPLILCLV